MGYVSSIDNDHYFLNEEQLLEEELEYKEIEQEIRQIYRRYLDET